MSVSLLSGFYFLNSLNSSLPRSTDSFNFTFAPSNIGPFPSVISLTVCRDSYVG